MEHPDLAPWFDTPADDYDELPADVDHVAYDE